ncbi:NAD(P)-dependent oxidoreductase [Rhizobium sp. P38BS-XIX]|uniref:NAD-dependent epimerase/dehydratase family protein n=1 Tax=Rhizobium sp. P38BS-XIX TaxID=2726740 RepID=UPI0014563466|nr:NAD(P)-dependent oxidoreductase [Rhizobium sp. P38BS-XIX]NLR96077.1 NAD(P)-dependent oxidoreductase [Rhizobium sp. P38BS-XIX]
MRIVLTGSSGRLGRAMFHALADDNIILGIDRSPSATTRFVGDFTDGAILRDVLQGADAVIHCAALHAPHVGTISDDEFWRINVEGTRLLAEAAIAAGIKRFVFTSTTALYGHAVALNQCTWLDEQTEPHPRTIYHRTKLTAERIVQTLAGPDFQVRVLRMARSFPEQADVMAVYRLHRGIDIRDVADAHAAALINDGDHFQRHIVSATTPFELEDRDALATNAPSIIRLRAPALAAEFDRRHWTLPQSIDRIYASTSANHTLGWRAHFGPEEILAQMDQGSPEVLLPLSATGKPSQ